ncbi:MAG: chloride channel protein [Chloroflexi bacterium]|nr:chloride channel protein [Chloroflexota bacterium]
MSEQMRAEIRSKIPAENAANFRLLLVSWLSAAIGIGAGIIAFILYTLIGFVTNLAFFQRFAFSFASPRFSHLGPLIIIIPVIGGIIVGIMAKYGSPKIKGHGIPEAMEAVLVSRSRIEPKVAILKPLSAAIAIGTGGPFGAEGPIIQTGGAVGSIVGQVIQTTAAERKVLLACGAAAGMSATFSTPIAGVVLAIELLLFEFRARSFIPLVIASTLATSVHYELMGQGPMFGVGTVNFGMPQGLFFYIILGVICGIAAIIFTKALYWVEDQFDRLPVDQMWWPAIGALALGVIGFFVPRVLGVGYDTITDILTNRLSFDLLLLVMVFKALALVISLGSGTSGGLLAPMFMSSAAMGAVFATLMNGIVPGLHLDPAAFGLVAMGAVFGAASRAAFTFIIFAFEVTRDYNSVLPLMLVSVIADLIAIFVMRDSTIMTMKLVRRGLRVNQEYEVDVLQQVSVGDVMATDVVCVPADMQVSELADQIARNGKGEPFLWRYQAVPIVDQQGNLAGIITYKDVLNALQQQNTEEGHLTVLEGGSRAPIVAYPDESVYEATIRMLQNDVGRLPVVSRSNPKKVVGYLGRSGVMRARLRRLQEEQEVEPGWFARWSS